MRTPHWPMFDLVVRTPRLTLQYPDDDIALALAELATRGIHDPAFMPFSEPWTDTPVDDLPRKSLQHFWLGRAKWAVDDWNCVMAVIVDGEVVGAQDVGAKNFSETRSVNTGSWLTQSRQGEGIGKEMRAAILHLAFAGLAAEIAFTAAWHDNERSLGVTRALGYEPNGFSVAMRRDRADRMLEFSMTREQWQQRQRDDITVEGLEPCLPLFGLV